MLDGVGNGFASVMPVRATAEIHPQVVVAVASRPRDRCFRLHGIRTTLTSRSNGRSDAGDPGALLDPFYQIDDKSHHRLEEVQQCDQRHSQPDAHETTKQAE
ncbi:hypothetical protein AVEN_208690-1 [Araneus ventricosus]|uniref:Uncharacterized protein n=1 Tax=Araneus ventricosus TaxID=182803 RepID=A0A4Y2FEZ6_ARAVE|nr:hypothetical protein AVEN_208690-1 [Araneus ventricosus]